MKRHSSHARVSGTDDTGTASPNSVSVPSPSPDLSPLQPPLSGGGESHSQRGTHRVMSLVYHTRHSVDAHSAAGPLPAVDPEASGGPSEPQEVQVAVAPDGSAQRPSSPWEAAAAAAAAPPQRSASANSRQHSLSFGGAHPVDAGGTLPQGAAAVSLRGGYQDPQRANTGPSPFVEGVASAGPPAGAAGVSAGEGAKPLRDNSEHAP